MFGKLYLSNKMTGIKYFNAPWFYNTTQWLTTLQDVEEVFNPAAEDVKMGFDPYKCSTGSVEEAAQQGFDLHKALALDTAWICGEASGLLAGPDWWRSKGAITEVSLAQALGLPCWSVDMFEHYWWMEDFMKSTDSQLPLISSNIVHPLGATW